MRESLEDCQSLCHRAFALSIVELPLALSILSLPWRTVRTQPLLPQYHWSYHCLWKFPSHALMFHGSCSDVNQDMEGGTSRDRRTRKIQLTKVYKQFKYIYIYINHMQSDSWTCSCTFTQCFLHETNDNDIIDNMQIDLHTIWSKTHDDCRNMWEPCCKENTHIDIQHAACCSLRWEALQGWVYAKDNPVYISIQ